MKRRHFIEHSMTAAAGLSVMNPLSALGKHRSLKSLTQFLEDNDKMLLIIFLNGGNDGLNTIVPLDRMSELNAVRPHVFIEENQLLGSSANGGTLAFHPAFKEIRDMYEDGDVHIIQNVGYEEQNFSHFRSTDIWMSGSESDEIFSTGIMGRYLDDRFPGYPEDYPSADFLDPLAIEANNVNTLKYNGPNAPMSYLIANIEEFNELINNEFNSPNPNTPAGLRHDFIQLIKRQSNEFGQRISDLANSVNGNESRFPQNEFGQQLGAIARLIEAGIKTPIFNLSLGSFDTHADQVSGSDNTNGLHADLLSTVSTGVKAFMDEMERLGKANDVIGMTFSEFGRTIVSNDNGGGGTDHGAAAPMFIFGKSVNGGVTGENPVIESNMTWVDNLPYEFDFKRVYSSIFEEWFCTDQERLDKVFTNQYDSMNLVSNPNCNTVSNYERNNVSTQNWAVIKDNPIMTSTLGIHSQRGGGIMRIKLVTSSGRIIAHRTLHSLDGHFETSINGLSSGAYFVHVEQKGHNQTLKMMKL